MKPNHHTRLAFTLSTIKLTSLALFAVTILSSGQAWAAEQPSSKPVKVFILAGQSNMEGQGSVDHDDGPNGAKGNLAWSMVNSQSAKKMKKLKNEKGEWVVRDDVQVSFKVGGDKLLKGGLTVGFTGYAADGSRRHMGPELGFGFVLGDFYQEPVLLIKTAWGGHSLHGHFRSPSSGLPAYDTGDWPKREDVGQSYRQMVKEVRAALAALGDQKYEIAGFYWQQGYNDMVTPQAIPEYAQLLVNLVSDLRKEFNVPNMPVVVGQLGNEGPVAEGAMFEFRKAQEAGTKRIKNAVFVKTTDFARPAELSPCPTHGHHWFANAESYFLIGDACGEGMKSLLK